MTATEMSQHLCSLLTHLSQNPYPHVPNPESCKKRASVAVVLRIRPSYGHWPSAAEPVSLDPSQPLAGQLENFFAQPWVQNGDAEVVFIKRATRVGDRWTGHVALPGGKRDPEDESDKATAIRETSEEIGLDLTSADALFVGNLPERVVSTSWGKVPIMVLCPFVFLYTKPDIPPLKLQPTEVAAAHWVPLRVLLSPSVRTYEYVDTSDRFARQGGFLVRSIIRSLLGRMRFSAIRLIPSESLHCSSSAEFFPEVAHAEMEPSLPSKLFRLCVGEHAASSEKTRPLLLWGLTLGIMADFLDQLPPHNAVKLWSYPTFTTLDTRFFINVFTAGLKKRNQARLQSGNQTAMDSETEAVATSQGNEDSPGDGTKRNNASRSYAMGTMLEGYYDLARRGVWAAIAARLLGSLALILYIVRRFRRR